MGKKMNWVLLGIIVVMLAGCSSSRIMKNCESLGQNFWDCEEP